jgi:cytochrome P450
MPTCPFHFNPLTSPHLENPYPVYAQAREEAPIFFSPIHGAWVVTRYEDVLAILRDPSRFSSAHVFRRPVNPTPEVLAELAHLPPEIPLLVSEDPPTHRRTRGLVSKAFSPTHVAAMAPRVQTIAHELIDHFCTDRPRVDRSLLHGWSRRLGPAVHLSAARARAVGVHWPASQ